MDACGDQIHQVSEASRVTKGWDDQIDDILLKQMVKETVDSVRQGDPAQGDWCVNESEINV